MYWQSKISLTDFYFRGSFTSMAVDVKPINLF